MEGDRQGSFGGLLRSYRERAALTQEELAERARLTAKAIGALERGERRRPYPGTVRALGLALGLDDVETVAFAASVERSTPAPPLVALGDGSSEGDRSSPWPAPPGTFIGRTGDLAQLVVLLGSDRSRLVTVTGPGGVGKTRLAWEVARTFVERGVAMVSVDLAPVRTTELVLTSISRAFGLRAAPDDPVAALASVLAGRDVLLVLDNLEQVVESAPAIADLVARCPRLVVLATSRSPLRVRAEVEFPLAPLALPPASSSASEIAATSAVQLFAERARGVRAGFVVDASNAPSVAAICARLDGLPLAIELAATHVRYLDADQLLDRLDRVIDSTPIRDLPERQHTMRATLEWSRELLTAEEQELLTTLWVFAGTFETDQVERLCGARSLRPLEGLIDQSLVSVRFEPGRPQRLRMLESVRTYARSLVDAERDAAVRMLHAEFFHEYAGSLREPLRGPAQARSLVLLDHARADLGAAVETLLELGAIGRAAEIGWSTWLYWALRGHAAEALLRWGRVVDAATAAGDQEAVTLAELTRTGLRLATGDVERSAIAAARIVESLDEADPAVLVEALVLAALAHTFTGDHHAAIAFLDRLDTIEGAGAWSDSHGAAARGQLALITGDLAGGDEQLSKAESVARAAGGPFTLATVLNIRATQALLLGDDDLAFRRSAEAAVVGAGIDSAWTLVYTLPMLAVHAGRRKRPDLAALLLAAGASVADTSLTAVAFRPDREAAAGLSDQLRQQLGDERFAEWSARGHELGVEDVLDIVEELNAAPEPG